MLYDNDYDLHLSRRHNEAAKMFKSHFGCTCSFRFFFYPPSCFQHAAGYSFGRPMHVEEGSNLARLAVLGIRGTDEACRIVYIFYSKRNTHDEIQNDRGSLDCVDHKNLSQFMLCGVYSLTAPSVQPEDMLEKAN